MDSRAMEKDLLDLEKRYWQTMKDKDVEAARRLTDFPCIVAGATGAASVDEERFASMMSGAPWSIKDFKLGDDAQVRMLSEDVAIVAYKVHEDLTVDGKPVSIDAADASVWVKRDGKWLCALHTESLAGDPYGRDRTTAH